MPNPTGDVKLASDGSVLGRIEDYERFFAVQAQAPDGTWGDLSFAKGGLASGLPERYRVAYEALVTPMARFASRRSQGFDRLADATTSVAVLSSIGFGAAMRIVERTVVLVATETVVA